MNAPHTLQAQLEAALAKNKDLEQDLHAERYARNLPDPWASSKEKP